MLLARSWISRSVTGGELMVSMTATVSPKSLFRNGVVGLPAALRQIGNLTQFAADVLPYQFRVLLRLEQIDVADRQPGRLIERTCSTDGFSAIFRSILRVTSCSTFSASAPG